MYGPLIVYGFQLHEYPVWVKLWRTCFWMRSNVYSTHSTLAFLQTLMFSCYGLGRSYKLMRFLSDNALLYEINLIEVALFQVERVDSCFLDCEKVNPSSLTQALHMPN